MNVVLAADVPRIRAAVHDQLRHLAVPAHHIDLTTLLLTEVVTNALRHGLPPITATVIVHQGQIRVEVCDSSDAPPVVLHTPPDSTGGRGMKLVSSLSSRWGWEELLSGKCVWFELLLLGQQRERVPA